MKSRFHALCAYTSLAIASCLPAASAHAAPLTAAAPAGDADDQSLQMRLDAFVRRAAPGRLGVAVLDLADGRHWEVNGGEAFPMMSVFKAPLGATVLDRIEHGELSFDQRVTITRAQLRPGASEIRERFQGERETFSVRQLLELAVSRSDNTAADALVRLVGGPQVVTRFLIRHGIDGLRVDMDEGTVSRIFNDIGPDDPYPTDETLQARDARLQRGYRAYLADPRNRATPVAAVAFLRRLWGAALLSPASTHLLLELMYAQTTPNRLRRALPGNVRFADKCGTSESLDGVTAAYNDIGIMTGPDGHTVLVAAFLTASHASDAERAALFADLGHALSHTLLHQP